jgi:hypothetical protein
MFRPVARIAPLLSQANWLTKSRVRAYLVILAAMLGLAFASYMATAHDGLDLLGRPVGPDFASFWTASQLALAGQSAEAWNPTTHHAAQIAVFGQGAAYAAFFYPPPYLLVCLPLALMPYSQALGVWLLATGLAWVAVTRAWLDAPRDWLAVLAFPAVLLNIGHGQNGFLTAALLGGAALLNTSRPWLTGVLIGALIIKPHLAVLTPLFLLLTGNWRAILSAALTAAALCVLSLIVFGPEAWRAFFESSALARLALEQDLVGYAKMQSTFAAARLLGAPLSLAWGLQVVSALVAIVGLWRVARGARDQACGAALVCATLLTTPFLLDYDLILMGIPLAWLFNRARREGFLAWEKIALLAGFVLPLVARPLAMSLHLPIAPLVLLGLLTCIHRRVQADRVLDAPLPLLSPQTEPR